MKQGIKKKNRLVFILPACLVAFFLFVSFIFSAQHKKLGSEFNNLIEDNLSFYTHGQRRQINGIIADMENKLGSMAMTISATHLAPETDWFEVYLKELSDYNNTFVIDYISADELRDMKNRAQEGEQKELQRLLEGNKIISEIYYSESMGGKYYFSVAQPILDGDAVCGALRARIDASVLTMNVQKSGMFQKVNTLIADKDGNIYYAGDTGYQNNGNLFDSIAKNGINQETANTIQELFQQKVASYIDSTEKEKHTIFQQTR